MDVLGLLTGGELTVEGRLVVASNVTLLGTVAHGGRRARCVYKPVAGERPLWDFPDGTLARREAAAYLVSEAAGWHVVPPTVLRPDGPAGAGMCQLWLDQPEHGASDDGTDTSWIDVVPPERIPRGSLPILEGVGADGSPVILVHDDHPGLRRLALFDVVINNADRKGGHVLAGGRVQIDGGEPLELAEIVGVDHGVSFHEEPKLRTVLWGWAGEALTQQEYGDLQRLREHIDGSLGAQLAELLSEAERAACAERITHLLDAGQLPEPHGRMPVPWPAF